MLLDVNCLQHTRNPLPPMCGLHFYSEHNQCVLIEIKGNSLGKEEVNNKNYLHSCHPEIVLFWWPFFHSSFTEEKLSPKYILCK